MKKLILSFVIGLFSCASFAESGVASWYGHPFHGRTMANGKTYNMHANTCAHKTLPLGSRILVTNHSNGKSIFSTVTDRGPFIGNRILDMSLALKNALDCGGLCKVTIAKALK